VIGEALAVAMLTRRMASPVGRWCAWLLERRWGQLGVGAAIVAVAVLLLMLGFLRPWLFGPVYVFVDDRRARTYDEASLIRLSWFLTIPGFGLALAGLALVALRRWRAEAWALVLPTACLLPLYAYRAEVSSRLMWWTRRFIPTILPGLVVLTAVAVGVGLALAGGLGRGRWPVRVAATVATSFRLVVFVGQSLPLRRHHEHGGSFETIERIARAAGDRQGVFLWPQTGGLSTFGGAVWLQQGQVGALLPERPDPAYVRSFVRGFPGQPVFLVARGHDPPRAYADVGLRRADQFTYLMPAWRETDQTRPSSAQDVPIALSSWQVVGT
jgi:hypothetical protein